MAEQQEYPDVLGAITGGSRHVIKTVQCAVGIHPQRVMVRQPVELLVVLQSAIDQAQDVTVTVKLPARAPDGQPLRFSMPKSRVKLRLEPGEVGVLHLPIVPQPPTPPAKAYPVMVQVQVRAPRRAEEVRPAGLGQPPTGVRTNPLRIAILQDIDFVTQGKGDQLRARFAIEPGSVQTGPLSLTDKYDQIWLHEDMAFERQRVEEATAAAEHLALHFARDAIFDPVRATTERTFAEAGIELLPGEALLITKSLCYVYEDALQTEAGFTLHDGRWFQWLTKIIARSPEVEEYDLGALAGGELYLGAVYDAVRVTMPALELHARQRYGRRADHDQRAEHLFAALQGEADLTLEAVYLPLVMAGVTLNMNIYRQYDDLWEPLDQLKAAMQIRREAGLPREMAQHFKTLEKLLDKEEDLMRRSRIERHDA